MIWNSVCYCNFTFLSGVAFKNSNTCKIGTQCVRRRRSQGPKADTVQPHLGKV